MFPEFKPSFFIEAGASIFTIGSCFARNIEEVLQPLNFDLPTMRFPRPDPSEWPHRSNGLLNEYTPGTISQRILYALDGKHLPADTIVASGSLYADLLFPPSPDVTNERATERRNQTFDVYTDLKKAYCVIITLGYIESWFDNQTQTFINRMPPHSFVSRDPKRFSLRVLDVYESYPLLEKALGALCDSNIKVILTVSPVPLNLTFTMNDCITANEFSKSVLRVCAERLSKRFSNVDYFPSYEIVKSGGLNNYISDNIHVKDEVVSKVTNLMVKHYLK